MPSKKARGTGPSRAKGKSSMFVPSFFSDVGCCSQRLGWVPGLPRFRGISTQVHL